MAHAAFLRFHAFVTSLRETILDDINKVLAMMLPKFGHTGQIRISSLPTRSTIERMASQLDAGAHPRDVARELARP